MSRPRALAPAALGLEGLTIDRASSVPLYAQMRDQLQRVLARRRVASLSTFFTDEEIARHFGVSRMTARQAIGELVRVGMLHRRKGVGTFITAQKVVETDGPDIVGNFFEEWPRHGSGVVAEILVCESIPCPPERLAALGLEPGEVVLHFVRRRLVDGVPVSLDFRWVASRLGDRLDSDELRKTSLHAHAARTAGSAVGRSRHEIEAARCTPVQADLLELERDEPVLIRHLDVFARDGSSLWTGESVYRADLYKYRIELRLSDPAARVDQVMREV